MVAEARGGCRTIAGKSGLRREAGHWVRWNCCSLLPHEHSARRRDLERRLESAGIKGWNFFALSRFRSGMPKLTLSSGPGERVAFSGRGRRRPVDDFHASERPVPPDALGKRRGGAGTLMGMKKGASEAAGEPLTFHLPCHEADTSNSISSFFELRLRIGRTPTFAKPYSRNIAS